MPPQGDQCIFCQLISNPDELRLVGETDNFYAWLEYPEPRAKGQTNVVPKDHVDSLMDLGAKEYAEAMNLVREVMEKMKKGLGADGITTAIHVDEVGGQMLDHMYIQVIPRYESDENAGTPVSALFPKQEVSDDKYDEIESGMKSVDVDFGVEHVEPHPDSQRFKEEPEDTDDHDEEDEESEESSDPRPSSRGKQGKSYSWD